MKKVLITHSKGGVGKSTLAFSLHDRLPNSILVDKDPQGTAITLAKVSEKELTITKKLFPGANFVTIDSIEHDKKIALILGLTHLMNLAFANILARDETIILTEKMSGTTFKAQKIIAESILTETPELINTIISNPELRKYGEEFWRDVGRLLSDSQEGKREDVINYVKACQEKISKNVDLNKSSKKLSNMVNLLDK